MSRTPASLGGEQTSNASGTRDPMERETRRKWREKREQNTRNDGETTPPNCNNNGAVSIKHCVMFGRWGIPILADHYLMQNQQDILRQHLSNIWRDIRETSEAKCFARGFTSSDLATSRRSTVGGRYTGLLSSPGPSRQYGATASWGAGAGPVGARTRRPARIAAMAATGGTPSPLSAHGRRRCLAHAIVGRPLAQEHLNGSSSKNPYWLTAKQQGVRHPTCRMQTFGPHRRWETVTKDNKMIILPENTEPKVHELPRLLVWAQEGASVAEDILVGSLTSHARQGASSGTSRTNQLPVLDLALRQQGT
ncbi:hypothetical protein B0H10DRAFT_1952181 [Mycena sp. CBHHK59/15]|nr:hypothetical protein B0H10DRAFT_1952181 [Mycena sp. CBHHK59/15]